MYYFRFTHPDGSTHVWINMESVHAASQAADGKVTLHTPTFTVEVDGEQFEKALSKVETTTSVLCPLVTRLTQAIDRLSVRIPTSIRLHM